MIEWQITTPFEAKERCDMCGVQCHVNWRTVCQKCAREWLKSSEHVAYDLAAAAGDLELTTFIYTEYVRHVRHMCGYVVEEPNA